MTGTQASLPALADTPWPFPCLTRRVPGEGPGLGCSTARQAEGAEIAARLLGRAWKCRVKFRDCSGRRGRNRAIPLALVTFCLFIPAADLIWNLERL